MKVRQSISQKIAIGVLAVSFFSGLGSHGLVRGRDRFQREEGWLEFAFLFDGQRSGKPDNIGKSSPSQSGAPSSPAGSGQSSTTPLSTSTDSQTSYRTYTQPDSGETPTSYEGSVGSEATAAGSKKKKGRWWRLPAC